MISEVLNLSTKSCCSRCCMSHLCVLVSWVLQVFITSTRCVAPLPSSATRPRSSSLGGSQERHGEWYQSEITKHSEHHNVFNHRYNVESVNVQLINVIEASPHDNKSIPLPPSLCQYPTTCENPTKSTPNSTNAIQGSQHHCPPYDSGCPQTQY